MTWWTSTQSSVSSYQLSTCKHSEYGAANLHSDAQAFVLVAQRIVLPYPDHGRVPRTPIGRTAMLGCPVSGPHAPRGLRPPFPFTELGPVPGNSWSGTPLDTGSGIEERLGIGGWLGASYSNHGCLKQTTVV